VKDGERIACDVRRGHRAGTYALVITRPDAPRIVEEVDHPTALIDRIVAITSSLRNEGWQPIDAHVL
jgi:hypothetical protein